MKKELWKTVEGFPLYEISSYGRVRSYHRGRIKYLIPSKNSRGYLRVQLTNNHGKQRFFVHRLVAMAFVPNIENKPHVNHLDNDPRNNRADNLEWVTPLENMQYSAKQGRNKRTDEWIANLHKAQIPTYKPVVSMSRSGKIIKWYPKLNAVAEDGFQPSCVSNVCNGKRQSHGGMIWKFA